MNIDEIESIVDRIDYKPGWALVLRPDQRSLQISRVVPDSRDPGRDVKVGSVHPIPPVLTQGSLNPLSVISVVTWVKTEIRRCELHELDEFFRLDGQLVDDPHKDGRMQV